MSNHSKPLLIETMRVDPGANIALLSFHLHRLQTSALALGYCYDEDSVVSAIDARLTGLQQGCFRLRLTLSATGCLAFEQSSLSQTIEPVSLLLSPVPLKKNAWLSHKTTHRAWYQQAAHILEHHPPIFDVVFFNEQEQLCEGSRSNIYIQKNGEWLTPPVECGLLAGVKRAQLLATEQVKIATISRAEFLAAPKVRVSNALRGWLDATLATTAAPTWDDGSTNN